MKKKYSIFFLAVFSGVSFFLQAQNPQWVFYTHENTALPDYPMELLIVDRDDNIWVGTYGAGLVKYDGAVWTVYNKENSWLPGDTITALAEDNDGNIWIATSHNCGLSKFDGTYWRVYTPANSLLPDDKISSIAFDNDNNIWLGINIINGEDADHWYLLNVEGLSVADEPVWTFYYEPFNNPQHYGQYVQDLVFDQSGILWFATQQSQCSFDGESFTSYYDIESGGCGAVTVDQNNHIWFLKWHMTSDTILLKYDGNQWEYYIPDIPYDPELHPPGGYDYNSVRSLAVDEENNIWISTDTGLIKFTGVEWTGFYIADIYSIDFSSEGVLWAGSYYNSIYAFDEGVSLNKYNWRNTGLASNDIRALKTDQDGNTWVGLWHNGLACFNGHTWKVFHTDNSPLPHDDIRAIEEDDQGNIWIATQQGLAVKQAFYLPGQQWITYTPDNSELPASGILCLHYGNGLLWIGTSLGLTRFDGENWVTFTTENSPLPHNGIRSIVADPENNIWIGTYSGGLCKIRYLSINNPVWEIFNTENSNIPHNGISALEADNNGFIWLGTNYNGLTKFDGTTFTTYTAENSDLPDDQVTALNMDEEGTLWIGTLYGDLVKFDGEEWFVFDSENSEFPDTYDAIYSMDIDEDGNKWIGIDGTGIAVYNEEGVTVNDELIPVLPPADGFTLQNFPNPFSNYTSIQWYSPLACRQRLALYDITGKEIAVLLDEYKPAGFYQLDFNSNDVSSGLPAGIYLVRLQTGNCLVTRKIIVTK